MSEESKNEAAQGDLQAQIESLTSELQALSATARTRWKVGAVVLVIVCLVVAIYLGVIYSRVKPYAEPGELVDIFAPTLVDKVTEEKGQWVADLKDRAPDVMKNFVKPELVRLQGNIDQYRVEVSKAIDGLSDELIEDLGERLQAVDITAEREKLAKQCIDEAPARLAALKPRFALLKIKIEDQKAFLIKTLTGNADDIVDYGRDLLIDSGLPLLRSRLADRVSEAIEPVGSESGAIVERAVDQVLAQHMEDIKVLEDPALEGSLKVAFEEAAGPVLDEFAKGAETAVKEDRRSLEDLIARAKSGEPLSREDELHLRFIQLWKTYWNVRMLSAEE
ncbi:MAG: hypothetical protein QGI33_01275 [Candidatus Brocadiia bacterium]|jgi:hypothetical protein|nr:hypothetical protein [Candidatus Brocadiia bacterium]